MSNPPPLLWSALPLAAVTPVGDRLVMTEGVAPGIAMAVLAVVVEAWARRARAHGSRTLIRVAGVLALVALALATYLSDALGVAGAIGCGLLGVTIVAILLVVERREHSVTPIRDRGAEGDGPSQPGY